MSSSILRPWVTRLGLRHQGLLLTAIRGCDTMPKFAYYHDRAPGGHWHPAKQIIAAIRYAVLQPFDEREVDKEVGTFMSRHVPTLRINDMQELPFHFVMHVIHVCEAIGTYFHTDDCPTTVIGHCGYSACAWSRNNFWEVYKRLVRDMHLRVEDFAELEARLNEDRIESGNIVMEKVQ